MARLQIQRINYFLRVILCRLFITSINNLSQAPTQIILIGFLKSTESNPGLAGLLYTSNSACQHPVNFIFFTVPAGAAYETPKKPTIITYPVNLSTSLLTLFLTTISFKAPCPERTAHYTAFLLFVKRLFLRMLIYRSPWFIYSTNPNILQHPV